jgi:signal transduction histidine kinase/CheY-like chemotaxis protein
MKCGLKVALLLFLLQMASAVSALELNSFPGGAVPGVEMIILDDPAAELSFEEAQSRLQAYGQSWVAPGQPNMGYRQGAIWIRVDLANQFLAQQQWVAFSRFSQLSQVDFFYRDSDGSWQQKTAGSALPFRARDLTHRSINFTFPVFPGESQQLYFRVVSDGALQFPLELGTRDYFSGTAQQSLFTSGLYFGLLTMIAIYCLIVWFSSREPAYLSFTLLMLSGAMYTLASKGIAFQYLWPENPNWGNKAASFFALLSACAVIDFLRKFLVLKQLDTRLDQIARYYSWITAAAAATCLVLPAFIVNRLSLALTFVGMGVSALAGLQARRQKTRAANYFMYALVVLLLGVLVEIAHRAGVILPPLLAYNGLQLSSLIAIGVLALGLSDRLKSMMESYRLAQEAVLQANQTKIDALQQADNVKEEFIANVSHELRTPLTGIIGLAEIMLAEKDSGLNNTQRETLTLMKVSAQRLSSLVNDVIDFSAMKNGQLELKQQDVDLQKVCSVVARMTRPLIGEKPIKLIERYPSERLLVSGDEDRLQQVLFNLVANAIKFTPHGPITISVERLDVDVRVSVRDTGIGISEEEQGNIFKRFYQIDSDSAREAGGTGLGLSISQRLLELHDSEIILRSQAGEGALFYFDLPLKRLATQDEEGQQTSRGEAEQLASEILAEQQTGLAEALQASELHKVDRRKAPREVVETEPQLLDNDRKGTILVVDDEYLNVRIVESHLSANYEVITALSGADALAVLSSRKPDIMILDLMMPVMTGYQVCQVVRKRYDAEELPIIMLTAKNRVEDLVKGLNMGANDYITKPFSKEELKVRVNKQFELMQLQQVKRDYLRLNWQLKRYQENEHQLREREQRLAALLDVTGDPILAVDEAGLLIFANHSAEILLGITAGDYVQKSVNRLSDHLQEQVPDLASDLHFPFRDEIISLPDEPVYQHYELNEQRGRYCLLTITMPEQEFFLLVFEDDKNRPAADDAGDGTVPDEASPSLPPAALSLPQIVSEINRNVERTHKLGEYLAHIKPEDLQNHRELIGELKHIDTLIGKLSATIQGGDEEYLEEMYREALVKVMQDCHFYWQKVTGESIIDLAEKSRIWSVSVDNGRLRTRSMNRYLSLDKLPANPRWRQVARTAYFVISKVSHDEEARNALEASVNRLQELVEERALN